MIVNSHYVIPSLKFGAKIPRRSNVPGEDQGLSVRTYQFGTNQDEANLTADLIGALGDRTVVQRGRDSNGNTVYRTVSISRPEPNEE